jgi:TRAP-type mannitol/chloroaromatic compound transport system substrate-binding protein
MKALSLTAIAAAAVAFSAHAQQPAVKNLKFQSTWPASLTLQDNFRFFADRMDKLTSGQVKIEVMAAGQIVPPFEILDATHKKVIDGGHGMASPAWITWITSAGCTRPRVSTCGGTSTPTTSS